MRCGIRAAVSPADAGDLAAIRPLRVMLASPTVKFSETDLLRIRDGHSDTVRDRVVVEEPLEIRLHGRPFVVSMRTPGADRDLAAGFLFSERIIRTADDIGTIEYCRDQVRLKPDTTYEADTVDNTINVTLVGESRAAVERALEERRHVVANSSCGVCGRQTIDALRSELVPVAVGFRIDQARVSELPDRLQAAQPTFHATGGLHAAAIFDRDATLIASAEDVGRHNAVDKVIGRLLLNEALPLHDRVLFVSGRTSFEIVQKAWCAAVSMVASVSAPSSLAIAVAREAGITLIGFVRNGGFNIYTCPDRIT